MNIFSQSRFARLHYALQELTNVLLSNHSVLVSNSRQTGGEENHRRRCAGAHQESRARCVSDNSQTEELAGKVTLTGVRQENRSHTLML